MWNIFLNFIFYYNYLISFINFSVTAKLFVTSIIRKSACLRKLKFASDCEKLWECLRDFFEILNPNVLITILLLLFKKKNIFLHNFFTFIGNVRMKTTNHLVQKFSGKWHWLFHKWLWHKLIWRQNNFLQFGNKILRTGRNNRKCVILLLINY